MMPNKPTVILVDDTQSDLEINVITLRRISKELRIVAFSEGEEVLDFLADAASRDMGPCMMLLDLKMPGMDGFEVLENIQKRGLKHFPIIVMSSSGLPDDENRSRRLGADGFCEKPMGLRENMEVFYRLLEQNLSPQLPDDVSILRKQEIKSPHRRIAS